MTAAAKNKEQLHIGWLCRDAACHAGKLQQKEQLGGGVVGLQTAGFCSISSHYRVNKLSRTSEGRAMTSTVSCIGASQGWTD